MLTEMGRFLASVSPIVLGDGLECTIEERLTVENTDQHRSVHRAEPVTYCYDPARTKQDQYAWRGLSTYGPFSRDTFATKSPQILGRARNRPGDRGDVRARLPGRHIRPCVPERVRRHLPAGQPELRAATGRHHRGPAARGVPAGDRDRARRRATLRRGDRGHPGRTRTPARRGQPVLAREGSAADGRRPQPGNAHRHDATARAGLCAAERRGRGVREE